MAYYRVNLDIFAGPMDLLLYLVRKEEVDIYDIPIAKITDQYIHHIEMLKGLDIDLAGDFLVMAATLIQLKSVMLLPKADPEQLESDELTDARAELIRQLLEYKKFKDAANLLNATAGKHMERFTRPDSMIKQLHPDDRQQLNIEQVSVWDLLEAFNTIVKATGGDIDISHIKDDTPIDLYQIEILHRLQTEGLINFKCIFESSNNRMVMIGLFLALLELIRENLVGVEQSASSGQYYLRHLTDEPAEEAVKKAVAESETPSGPAQPIPIVELPSKSQQRPAADKPQKTKKVLKQPHAT